MKGKRSPTRGSDPKEEARQAFIAGATNKWNAGEYGYTLNCFAIGGALKLKFTVPTRRQWTLPGAGDTPERRRVLTQLAMQHVLDWRGGKSSSVADASPELAKVAEELPLPEKPTVSALTCGEVWRDYVQGKWPGMPAEFPTWGRPEVRAYYVTLTPEDRKRAPSPDSLFPVLQSLRRVMAYPAFAHHVPVTGIEPGDWIGYTNWRRSHPDGKMANGEPYSYGTILTDFGRFHTALKYSRRQFPKRWDGAADPLEGAEVVRVYANLEEIGEERAQIITQTLREMGAWRALAAVMFAGGSGRRIGEIGADRNGFEGDGLRGTDFEVIGGRLHVIWRAEAAKGEGFGRADAMILAARSVAVAYRWLRRCHPNPLGPEHPLIWSPKDPSAPVSYPALNKAFKKAWLRAFGEQAPKGVAFHGYCRTVVTTLVDALGTSQAAEYTGRTIRTIEQHYKKKRAATQAHTTSVLDRVQAEAADRAGLRPNRNGNRNAPRESG